MKRSEDGYRGPFSVFSFIGAGTLPPGINGSGIKSVIEGYLVGSKDSGDFGFDFLVDLVSGSKSFGKV